MHGDRSGRCGVFNSVRKGVIEPPSGYLFLEKQGPLPDSFHFIETKKSIAFYRPSAKAKTKRRSKTSIKESEP
jgi:hypothetical protein